MAEGKSKTGKEKVEVEKNDELWLKSKTSEVVNRTVAVSGELLQDIEDGNMCKATL